MKTDKELYPVFELDVCTMSYAIDFILVGAKDENDVIQHLPEILKDIDKCAKDRKEIIKRYKYDSEYYKPTPVPNVYTDKPYVRLWLAFYAE